MVVNIKYLSNLLFILRRRATCQKSLSRRRFRRFTRKSIINVSNGLRDGDVFCYLLSKFCSFLKSLKGATLNLTHTDRYFLGLKSNDTKSNEIESILKTQNAKQLKDSVVNEIVDWNLNVKNVMDKFRFSLFGVFFNKKLIFLTRSLIRRWQSPFLLN